MHYYLDTVAKRGVYKKYAPLGKATAQSTAANLLLPRVYDYVNNRGLRRYAMPLSSLVFDKLKLTKGEAYE